ncbi:olfactory receptor 5AP2-like [Ambystoma mexicanum]|uniref:olfactory receptor 5AP2-like n=1 Tax=Ambystoma mexicanum TaxID=8296 RepID=UPI0037E8EB59
MILQNQTTEFILLGLTHNPWLIGPLFLIFMTMYATTLLFNGGLIVLIHSDHRHRTPMYLFISHLSLVDICYSSTVTPKMLAGFILEINTISFNGCMAQLFCYATFGGTESFLLAAMGYDRYVAICHPLQYLSIMTKKACILLVLACYTGALLNAGVQLGLMLRLSFCASNEIQHFFCDYPPLTHLSCTDTHVNRVVLLTLLFIIGMFSILVILTSYVSIFRTILGMHSMTGRRRAFSTCSSHFTAMTLFYGSVFISYVRPSGSYFPHQDMIMALFYTVVISTINPLIYSLRNADIKQALRMMLGKNL